MSILFLLVGSMTLEGIFLDARIMRERVREKIAQRRFRKELRRTYRRVKNYKWD